MESAFLIIVAEDDPDLTAMFHHYLTRCGYRVLSTSNAVEGLSIIHHESPAVIVLSLEMAWGGVDCLANHLQQHTRQRAVPAVILTGCTAEDNVSEWREKLSVFRYLRKPFLMGSLLDCIRAIESQRPDTHGRERSAGPRQFATAGD